ncbi:MerR family transcriptional regulator [Opitutus sp. ER46]|uniref:MerR family transcriptional regulator n=1 Tax=Opitutus sp. ER46 TaxID=2161864 RepID=UPI000D2F916E|nr:MerR family transcriptional regulator [Opitutus sp. ER46]PTX98913.1 MerR family transcriptional regulator [Opitutus sp. ER46]
MKTITVIARRYGLSRTTLLYYDRLGLLSPSYRTAADARMYSAEDEAKLARIVTYRRAGVPLRSIQQMMDGAPTRVNRTLEARLREIQDQISALRGQQRFIVEMLREAVLRGEEPKRTRDQWVELLRACAFTDRDLQVWHMALERDDPQAHARFLRRIGLTAEEAAYVRERSREDLQKLGMTPAPRRGRRQQG